VRRSIAMTGSTGALGRAIHDRLVERGHSVVRIGRRTEIRWDLRERLSVQACEALQRSEVVVHAAADVRLATPYPSLYRVNVGAVSDLVRTLESLDRPPRLIHVSSAFAAPGVGGHDNGYERSKYESEAVVFNGTVDSCVLRPSLIMGSSTDGAIGRFSGIYIFLRMLRLGLVPAIPGFGGVLVDVVPVDAVAAAAVDEIETASGRRVVGITAGSAAPSLRELVNLACDVFKARASPPVDPPKFVAPDTYYRLFRPIVLSKLSAAQRVLLETVEVFQPYFERDHVFESGCVFTRAQLLDTWNKSICYWLDKMAGLAPRGHEIWANRS
jgi:nucleoside-diphosphate-sugar epimerase